MFLSEGKNRLRAGVLLTTTLCLTAIMATPSAWSQAAPVAPFDMTGLIYAATVDSPGDPLSGGSITINHIKVIIPRNSEVQMPATTLGWGEVFSLAPSAVSAGGTQTGMAITDSVRLPGTYEAHLQGNIVNGTYIAGLVFLSQQSLNQSQGFIESIDYQNAELHVNGMRLQINDPAGRFSVGKSPDVRFTIDEDNPTVRSETAYPMCLPRTNPTLPAGSPGGGDDPLCPQINRPKDPQGNFVMIFTMPPRGTPGAPDPTQQMPFEVGDYITYQGALQSDSTGSYISAWQIIANVGVFTAQGVDPVYIAIDVLLQGTGGIPNPNFPQETTSKVKVEGFSTDPTRTVDIYAIDQDCNGVTTDRLWAFSVRVDPGPPTGAKKGRFRFVPSGGAFLPPPREVRVRVTGATNPVAANGMITGQYHAPDFAFIFPENLAVGNPPVPENLGDFVWLVNGDGPLHGDSNHVVRQLSPWPDLNPPSPTCVSNIGPPPAPSAPSAVAVASPATATANSVVQLDGTGSTPASGLTYSWTQSAGDPIAVSLQNANASVASFTAPAVTAPTTFNFTLTVTNVSGTASASASVTVNPAAQVQPPVAAAVATPNPAVSGATVSLNASGSNDPQGLPLSFVWTQTSGSGVTINGANTATASFTAPTIAAGQPGQSFRFTVTVSNGTSQSTASVTVTVNAATQPPVAAAIATPNPAASLSVVTLNGTGSTDPNGLPLTYSWVQTSGPAVVLINANTSAAVFTTPQIPAATTPAVLTFNLTVTNSANFSSSAAVSVTVNPVPDVIVITSATYRLAKSRLTINVTDTTVSAAIKITCTIPIINPATGQPVSGTMQNVGAGLYTLVLTGFPAPSSVTCVSSAGGTATTTSFRFQ